ncbi:MAG: hypothetical protein PWQ40_1570 [Archaeoglobus sp.]|jgi:hypothetical protein|uniref:Uncharacterized protein n=2 Tax=Archaeoglobus fulgidus TaxID=2234 RepID=A0A075WIV1_ARCFL|nr:hypothetical protein AFULGI_00024320 [Archaeoglobus fulgidus DSM 8774]KUJ92961.1 MAG: hypothetical protein XD40_1832 [Archaeoglobus fulgidus]KUK06452.1 MAG: hypothetical protein XD48_1325 [Archaeoglobus fulgidus]MDI3498201.1 hypothetical protein [Archaeoglobus sp.]
MISGVWVVSLELLKKVSAEEVEEFEGPDS